jgi:uncharacterized OB-fold protein
MSSPPSANRAATGFDWTVPRPFVHGEEATWFEFCRRGELRIQRCRSCERHIFYPRHVCPHCLAPDPEWVRASGRGTVHTFTIQHRPALGYEGPVPYVVAVIELDEGVRMLSRVTGEPAAVRIGQRVEVAWATLGEDFRVPVFAPVAEEGR